jgi:hypothetical protein
MKKIAEMSPDELEFEFQHLDGYFIRCRDEQHGISSKESIQFVRLAMALCAVDRGHVRSEYHNETAAEFVEFRGQQIEAINRLENSKTLDPFSQWMVKQNVQYATTEGVDAVVARLRVQGYKLVADHVLLTVSQMKATA